MISVAYALLLISFVFGNVPEAWAAPVGTRSVHVKTMRRVPYEKEHMRRVHHSATSVVQRDDVPVAVVAREPVTSSVAAPAPIVKAPVVARHEGHHQYSNPKSDTAKSDTASTETKRSTRRHQARGGASAAPRAAPRFQRDETKKPSVSKDKEKRKNDASDANVAREPMIVQKKPAKLAKTEQEKREPKTQNQRQPAPQPTSVRPIVMFRRALAFEDLD